jgi:hypothetical protein
MEKASEAILALRPVTFHYKSDAKETPQLVAEEVAKVNPALVLPDREGKPSVDSLGQTTVYQAESYMTSR